MKLTLDRVFAAELILAAIINERRPMPLRGKFLLARMHTKLKPEFDTIAKQRDSMIEAYGHKEKMPVLDFAGERTGAEVDADNFSVPADKAQEWQAAWAEFSKTEIEVDVQPISIKELELAGDGDGQINAGELQVLGELIAE